MDEGEISAAAHKMQALIKMTYRIGKNEEITLDQDDWQWFFMVLGEQVDLILKELDKGYDVKSGRKTNL